MPLEGTDRLLDSRNHRIIAYSEVLWENQIFLSLKERNKTHFTRGKQLHFRNALFDERVRDKMKYKILQASTSHY